MTELIATEPAAGRLRVSVIIPAWNREATVGRAIKSALAQSHAPLEVIVIDDGSSDGTSAVVGALAATEPRIRLIRQAPNLGGAAARNRGIDAAAGEFLAFLDSDDEWTVRHLERSLQVLDGSPDCALVFGPFYLHDGRRQRLRHCLRLEGDVLEYLFYGRGDLRTSTFVARRAGIREVPFDDALRKHQDWDLVLNLRRRFAIATGGEPGAILHVSAGDRLSAKPDPEASLLFFRKNRPHCTRAGWLLYFAFVIEATFRAERRSPAFRRYLGLLDEIDGRKGPGIRRLTALLGLPRIGRRLFLAACRLYCRASFPGSAQATA